MIEDTDTGRAVLMGLSNIVNNPVDQHNILFMITALAPLTKWIMTRGIKHEASLNPSYDNIIKAKSRCMEEVGKPAYRTTGYDFHHSIVL